MKLPTTLLTFLLLCQFALAAFLSLSLEQKVTRADVIAKVTVRKITRVMPEKPNKAVDPKVEGTYFGPLCIAEVEIDDLWKNSGKKTAFWSDEGKAVSLPKTILVPCEYRFEESPSSLTEGKSYVVFLEAMGANLYHPLDPACTYRVKDDRVSDSGIDSEPDPTFGVRLIPVADFKKEVLALVGKEQ